MDSIRSVQKQLKLVLSNFSVAESNYPFGKQGSWYLIIGLVLRKNFMQLMLNPSNAEATFILITKT